ncbi:hypothetical protein ACFQY4_06155 [Catellatospora bangladeshensis]|uniref:hypothetical protein n=1 Tax=Catellatospora bangladeshensis TaxID=310355 RepID=UPI00361377E4
MVKPPTAGSGSGVSAQTARSYQGTSSSGRGRPNTSTTQPSSNGAIPANASTAIRCRGRVSSVSGVPMARS